MFHQFLGRYTSHALTLLRIVTGLLFMQHGAQKLFGLLGGFGGTPGATAPLFSLMGVAGILEFFGGLTILIGLFTQPVAFLLSGEMAVAYFTAHIPRGLWPILNQGESTALYSFIYLFLATAGGGRLSVDALLFQKGKRA